MTILSVIQNVLNETMYATAPTIAMTSTDQTIVQLRTIAKRIGLRMRDRFPWRELSREHSFATVASQAAYALPGDFSHELAESFWNNSTAWRVVGPVTAEEWQLSKNGNVTPSITEQYRIKGITDSQLFLDPTPSAVETCVFEHLSRNCWRPRTWETGQSYNAGEHCFYDGVLYLAGSSGTTSGSLPTDNGGVTWTVYSGEYSEPIRDTDVFVISEHLLEMGLIAYFTKAKVYEDYAEKQAEFWEEVDAAYRKQAPAMAISLGRDEVIWPNMVDTGLTIEGSGG
jgi:hypothetical protein